MRGRPAPRLRGDEGFTLLEVMAALLVFVIVSTATVSLLILGLRTVRENTARVQAATIARTQLDSLRQRGAALVPVGVSTGAPTGTSARFTVRTTSQWVGLDQGATSACTAQSPGQAYLRVAIDVSSPDLKGPQRLESLIIPEPGEGPGAALTGPTGALALTVVDQLGQPVSDARVTGTDTSQPTNAFSLTTGSDGCLYLPAMKVSGSLKVTVGKAGYVASTPTGTTQTVQVTNAGLTRVAFRYAPATSIQFASGVPGFALAPTTPVTWQPSTTGAVASTVTAATGPTGLWPATTGFSAWLGGCTDSTPSAYGASAASFAFVAGGPSAAALVAAPVFVSGVTPGLAVSARYGGSDPACSGLVLDLGKADASGTLAVLLPYGTWTLAAGGQTRALPALTPTAAPAPAVFTLAVPTESPSGTPTASPTATPTASPTP